MSFQEEKLAEFEEKFLYKWFPTKFQFSTLDGDSRDAHTRGVDFMRQALSEAISHGRAEEAVRCEEHVKQAVAEKVKEVREAVSGLSWLEDDEHARRVIQSVLDLPALAQGKE